MKQFLILLILCIFCSTGYASTTKAVSSSASAERLMKTTPDFPLLRTQHSNSVLNVEQGIKAEQRGLNSRYFDNGTGIKQSPKIRYNHPVYPNIYGRYVPHTYRLKYYDDRGTIDVVGKTRTTEKEALTEEFSSILSNKKLSSQKKCTQISAKLKGANREEKKRILNEVLGLNCTVK